jgi:hypothetical protein
MPLVLAGTGACRWCGGRGPVSAARTCAPCYGWNRPRHPAGDCLRCGYRTRVSQEGTCRACMTEIRLRDDEWVLAACAQQPLPQRGLQLSLLLDGIRLPQAQPLRQTTTPVRRELPGTQAWTRRHAGLPPPAADPGICPPQIPGQLPLLRMPRTLTAGHARLISGRPGPELGPVTAIATQMQAALGKSRGWRREVISMAGLALAARDPDEALVREEDLGQLPGLARRAGEVLLLAGLLRPGPALPSPAPPPRARTRQAAGPPPGPRPLAWPMRQSPCRRVCMWTRPASGGAGSLLPGWQG